MTIGLSSVPNSETAVGTIRCAALSASGVTRSKHPSTRNSLKSASHSLLSSSTSASHASKDALLDVRTADKRSAATASNLFMRFIGEINGSSRGTYFLNAESGDSKADVTSAYVLGVISPTATWTDLTILLSNNSGKCPKIVRLARCREKFHVRNQSEHVNQIAAPKYFLQWNKKRNKKGIFLPNHCSANQYLTRGGTRTCRPEYYFRVTGHGLLGCGFRV
jgi:hypothetical protein